MSSPTAPVPPDPALPSTGGPARPVPPGSTAFPPSSGPAAGGYGARGYPAPGAVPPGYGPPGHGLPGAPGRGPAVPPAPGYGPPPGYGPAPGYGPPSARGGPVPRVAPPPARAPRRPWWSSAGTVGAVVLAVFSALTAAAYSSQNRGPVADVLVDGLAMLVGTTVACFLVARRRWAVPLTLAASATAVLLPLDSVTALIALPWVFATATRKVAWLCTAAVALATTAALYRDATRDPRHMVLAIADSTGQIAVASPVGLVITGLLCLGASVAAGLVRASRVRAEQAVADSEAQTARADTLHDQMSRQEERELIAREVHDTVAHHISLISLQASALEVQRGADDQQVQAAAQQVRASAQQAIAEMRGLISTLRSGEDGLTPGATLDDLAGLLDGARRQGRWVTSSVFVSDGRDASAALTRATFRIVQEALTNALKHAPGQPVEVSVRAAAATGVHIRVANPVTPGAPPLVAGTGSGLLGVRERAASVGGSVEVGVDAGWHVLEARLPWSVDGKALPSTS